LILRTEINYPDIEQFTETQNDVGSMCSKACGLSNLNIHTCRNACVWLEVCQQLKALVKGF
jgi:hypothetical protein